MKSRFLARPDLDEQDRSLLTRQLHHFPSGTSARTIVHTAQLILSGKFQVTRSSVTSKQEIGCDPQAYDWGDPEVEPSQVDLSKVTPPHALYVAQVIFG